MEQEKRGCAPSIMPRTRRLASRFSPPISEPRKKRKISTVVTLSSQLKAPPEPAFVASDSWVDGSPFDAQRAGTLLASFRMNSGSRLDVVSSEAAEKYEALGHKLSFPEKVYAMVCEADAKYPDAIRWVQNGAGFLVLKKCSNLKIILRKYFKHGNYTSLQRQLNMYGWRKNVSDPYKGTFFNSLFHRNCVPHHELAFIHRNAPPSVPTRLKLSPLQSKAVPRQASIVTGSSPITTSSKTPIREPGLPQLPPAAPYGQVTPFFKESVETGRNNCISRSFGYEGATVIAGSTSCITSRSVFWPSDHNSITPKVQNPSERRSSLLRLHSLDSLRSSSTLFAGNTNASSTTKGTAAVRSQGVQPPRKKGASWVSPFPLRSVGTPKENSQFHRVAAKEGRRAKILGCDIAGSRLPMTPILVRNLITRDDFGSSITNNSNYRIESPMMPAPVDLLRRQSSSSFLKPFVGVMSELSQALNVAYSDNGDDNDEAENYTLSSASGSETVVGQVLTI